jgi:alditol oxidase
VTSLTDWLAGGSIECQNGMLNAELFSKPSMQNDTVIPSSNWGGNVIFNAARVHRPGSIDSLRQIVAGCRRIRALGCGHSFSAIANTTDDLVLLDGLPQTVVIDPATLTATVPTGMSYSVLAEELHRAGFALANLASIPDISIAGACATGTHGSGNDQRVLAAEVTRIQLVGSDGDLVELQRDVDQDKFAGSVVALGALGIVTQLTLDIEPAYDMTQWVHLGIPLDDLQDRLDDIFSAGYSVSAFTDWLSGEAAVWLKCRVDEPESECTIGTPARRTVHPVPGMAPDLCTEQLGTAGPWHERLPHFRPKPAAGKGNELQSEFFLPRNAAQRAVVALREIGPHLAPVLLVSEVRTVRGDDLWLSPAYGRDSTTFHFTWMSDEAVVWPAIAAIEERLMPLGARSHWGKMSSVNPGTVITSYERAPDFERLTYEFDPTLKFRNDFVNSLFPID